MKSAFGWLSSMAPDFVIEVTIGSSAVTGCGAQSAVRAGVIQFEFREVGGSRVVEPGEDGDVTTSGPE